MANNNLITSFAPNVANPMILGPVTTQAHLAQGLADLPPGADLSKPFDWRVKGPYNEGFNLVPPYNQANCGNCWAMSSTIALADKFIIFKGLKGLLLDPLVTASCVTPAAMNHHCGGGSPYIAAQFFEKTGAAMPGSNCMSWQEFCTPANKCGTGIGTGQVVKGIPQYPLMPVCGQSDKLANCEYTYKAAEGSTRSTTVPAAHGGAGADPHATITSIKTAIANHGPVVGVFQVSPDLQYATGENHLFPHNNKFSQTNGIYIQGSYDDVLTKAWTAAQAKGYAPGKPRPNWGQAEGGGKGGWHAVEIIGWGSGNVGGEEVPYWIVKNSWSEKWGDSGYWKHAMWPKNKNTNLDVPQVFDQTSGHGGCVDFAYDPASGGKRGSVVGKFGTGGHSSGGGLGFSHDTWKKIMWALIIIVFLIVVYELIRWMAKMFKRGRRGHYR